MYIYQILPAVIIPGSPHRGGRVKMFEKLKEYKTRITFLAVMAMGLVASASAGTFDAITTLVDEIVLIMPAIVAMVVAAIPIHERVSRLRCG